MTKHQSARRGQIGAGHDTGQIGTVPNMRRLLNGDVVSVVEAERDLDVELSCEALKLAVPHDVTRCSIALQATMDTGHYFEVYPFVAYEQVNRGKALRYTVPENAKLAQFVNDLGMAKALLGAKATIRLKRPAPSHTLAYNRSAGRKARDAKSNKKSAKRKPEQKRTYIRSLPSVLQLRHRAAA